MKTTIQHLDTTTLPVFNWASWPGELEGPKGPGKLYKVRYEDTGRTTWVHESPRGWTRPLGYQFQNLNPPPLTQTKQPCPVGKCGCGEYHHCSQCGTFNCIGHQNFYIACVGKHL